MAAERLFLHVMVPRRALIGARLFWWLLIVTATLRGAADPRPETGRPFIQNFTPRDYRGHNQMWATAQTADGLLYFGNRVRVLEYDGVTWRQIKVPVPATYIRGLVLGADGRLYVGSTDELGYLERGATGATTYVSLTAKLPPPARQFGVILRALAHGNAVFFSTLHGVLRWQNGAFRTWTFSEKNPPALRNVGEALYLHRDGVGLFQWSGDDFAPLGNETLWRQAAPTAMIPMPDGEPLVALSNGTFGFLARDGAVRPWQIEAAAALKKFHTRMMLRMSSGLLVLGSATEGIVVLSADGRFLQQIDESNGLENQRVINLFEDREGSLWVDTFNGTSRIEVSSPLSIFDRNSGLGREYVRQFCRHSGALYGTSAGGLFRLLAGDPLAGKPAQFERVAVAPDNLWGLVSHRSGLLVSGTRGVALLAQGKLERISSSSAYALAMSRSDPDRVFVGCDNGLRFLHFNGARWIDEGALPRFDGEVRSVVEDEHGVLWAGSTTRGILKIVRRAGAADWQDAEVTTYLETHGLPKGQGWALIFPTTEGPLFVPQHGAYRYDAAADFFRPEGRLCPDARMDTVVSTVAQAGNGGYWLQTEQPEIEHSLRINALTPGVGGGFTWAVQPHKLEDKIGHGGARTLYWENTPAGEAVWVSAPDATVRLDVGVRVPPSPAWSALVREIQLPDGSKLYPATGRPAPRFTYAREPLVFAFAAPRFGSGLPHDFQTRVVGYEDEWSAWSPKSEATFTNLSGGPFTFEVRARDADGNISLPARFVFSVTPPWHRSRAALALYLVSFGGAVFGFVRWRLRAAERERVRLEQLVVQRTEELRLAKNTADDANRAKSVFLANMSHELRTPLNGVLGYAQVLMKDRELSPKNRERLQVVQTSGEHLLRMINEVLDLSKIEAGKMELTATPFHLPQLLRDIAAGISERAAQKNLVFNVAVASGLPDLIVGDPMKLRQVLDNLLGNAIKFTARGQVRFEVGPLNPADELIHFSVADTGVGMSPRDRAALFQPFQQAADGRPPEPGTGLGLAISQRLVELMGGKLEVESTPGTGSVFSFTLRLPVLAANAASDRKTGSTITGYRGDRRKLLVVDDVAINRHLLRDLLEPLGFEITLASGGIEALARAAETDPDLVLLDLRMPDLDGFELARRLHERAGARIKLIAMSASVLSFNRDDAFAAGCDDFLPKPFREIDLLTRIGMALQLEWLSEPGVNGTASAPAGPLVTSLSAGAIAELLAFAQRGEIAALRRRAAELRGDGLADAIDALARNFRMEEIRELLERHTGRTGVNQ